ncbi:MAG: hypothetical protein GTO48_04125, partial [Xanthomonadales bacterium]|nr:hypothetical protein [Xanthomonadales bacterium]
MCEAPAGHDQLNDHSTSYLPALDHVKRACGPEMRHTDGMGTLIAAGLVLAEFSARLIIAGVIIVRSRGTPATRLAWLVVILALPVFGI